MKNDAEFLRQFVHGVVQRLVGVMDPEFLLGRGLLGGHGLGRELLQFRRALQLPVTVDEQSAQHRQQPRLGVADGGPGPLHQRLIRLQIGLLHQILRVGGVLGEAQRRAVRGVQMRLEGRREMVPNRVGDWAHDACRFRVSVRLPRSGALGPPAPAPGEPAAAPGIRRWAG